MLCSRIHSVCNFSVNVRPLNSTHVYICAFNLLFLTGAKCSMIACYIFPIHAPSYKYPICLLFLPPKTNVPIFAPFVPCVPNVPINVLLHVPFCTSGNFLGTQTHTQEQKTEVKAYTHIYTSSMIPAAMN